MQPAGGAGGRGKAWARADGKSGAAAARARGSRSSSSSWRGDDRGVGLGSNQRPDGPRGRAKADKELVKKIDIFLGEFRIIVPALGALLGFQLVVAFQESFPGLPFEARAANFAGVASTALAILFLLMPSSYHRFTRELDESLQFLKFAQRSAGVAFLFIPLSLSLSLYVQAVRTFGPNGVPLAIGVGFFLMLVAAWWVWPMAKARRLQKAIERRARQEEFRGNHDVASAENADVGSRRRTGF